MDITEGFKEQEEKNESRTFLVKSVEFMGKRYIPLADACVSLGRMSVELARNGNLTESDAVRRAKRIISFADEQSFLNEKGNTPDAIKEYWDGIYEEYYRDKYVVIAKINGDDEFYVDIENSEDGGKPVTSMDKKKAHLFDDHFYASFALDFLKEKGIEASIWPAGMIFCESVQERMLKGLFGEEENPGK